jgi:hypothetical protein
MTFEITNTKGMDVKQAEDKIRKHYHDDLTYHGVEFFETVYMGAIIAAAAKALDVTRFDQECYLGYLPDDDVFISGWDTVGSEDEDDDDVYSDKKNEALGSFVILKPIDGGFTRFVKFENEGVGGEVGKGFYDRRLGRVSTYKALKKEFPNLVDIRLD